MRNVVEKCKEKGNLDHFDKFRGKNEKGNKA